MAEQTNSRTEGQQVESPPKRPKRKPRPGLIIGALVVVGIAGWLVWHFIHAGKESTDDATIEADVVPLSPRVAGQVVKLFVQENQAVKRGDPILALDDTDYVAHLHEQQASYDTAVAAANAADAQVQVAEAAAQGGYSGAEAQVLGSSAGVLGAQAQVAAAHAAVVRAKADVERTSFDLKRAKELFAAHAVPKQQLDDALTAHDAARAALHQAQAQLKAAETEQRVAQDRVREAQARLGVSRPVEAQIDAARANAKLAHAKADSEAARLEVAKLQVHYTRVYAPADGVVSSLGVHPGQNVQAGQAIAQFVPDATYVVANFKETQLNAMRVGQRAVVKVDAYPGQKIEARVESFSGGTGSRFALLPPDNATGNFVKIVQRVPVRIQWIRLPDGIPPLRAGLSVEVTVYEHQQVPAPAGAVAPEPAT